MHINFPKKQYTIEILVPEAEYMERVAKERGYSHIDGVIMSALRWHQILFETPGALEAVQALMPQLPSKKGPTPTQRDFDEFIERL